MIKPLVWSVNIPLVNRAWIRLLEGLLGPLNIRPEQLSRSFYYRAYFNMGTLGALFDRMGMPRNSLESLMGRKDPSGKSAFRPTLKTFRYLPRMMLFLVLNLNLGRAFKRKVSNLEKDTIQLREKLNTDFSIDQYLWFFRQIMDLSEKYNITSKGRVKIDSEGKNMEILWRPLFENNTISRENTMNSSPS